MWPAAIGEGLEGGRDGRGRGWVGGGEAVDRAMEDGMARLVLVLWIIR